MYDLPQALRERADALGRAKRPTKAIDDLAVHLLGAADEIENTRRNLQGRDDFICSKGLWQEFVDQLPKQE